MLLPQNDYHIGDLLMEVISNLVRGEENLHSGQRHLLVNDRKLDGMLCNGNKNLPFSIPTASLM